MVDKELELGKIGQGRPYYLEAGVAEDEIPFGALAIRGTDEEEYDLFEGADDSVIAGIAAFTNSGDIDELKFEENDAMRVLRKGVIWTKVSESDAAGSAGVEAGDTPVFDENGYLIAESEAESTTDGTDNAVKINAGEVIISGDPGDKVMVELNLPDGDIEFIDLSTDVS